MFNKPFIAVLAATMLTLGGCATDARYVDRQAPVAELRDKVVTGNASYRQRIALPARATFNVRLLDVSRADARSAIIAEETREIAGQQVPLPFSIRVKEQDLKTNMRYAVRATITDPEGKLIWTTDTVHSVDPTRFEQDLGTLNMVRVGDRPAASGLIGPQFKVEDINQTGLIDRSNVTVQFSQDGRVSGSAGCNRFTGDYSIEGQSLRIGPLAVTRRACVPTLGNQETRFLAILQDVTSWSVNSNGSVLFPCRRRTIPGGDTLIRPQYAEERLPLSPDRSETEVEPVLDTGLTVQELDRQKSIAPSPNTGSNSAAMRGERR